MIAIILDDNSEHILELNNNPLASYIHKSFKHLQNAPLPFSPHFDYMSKYYNDITGVINKLKASAEYLNVSVDFSKLDQQEYLNHLHKIYETGYKKGSNVWLDFHEMIHTLEKINNNYPFLDYKQVMINYRDKAGPLEKTFDRGYLKYSTHHISKGTCYAGWCELGKTPVTYWSNNEPDDIKRMCQLIKPWLTLRPTFTIALQDIDFDLTPDQKQKFSNWFNKHKEQWTKHWQLDDWQQEEITSVIPIGKLLNVDEFESKMDSGCIPQRVRLV